MIFLSAAIGGVLTVLLFVVCLLFVLFLRLARIGFFAVKPQGKPAPPPEPAEEKKPEKTSEPVYYIVERKKKRPKGAYGAPREITFR